MLEHLTGQWTLPRQWSGFTHSNCLLALFKREAQPWTKTGFPVLILVHVSVSASSLTWWMVMAQSPCFDPLWQVWLNCSPQMLPEHNSIIPGHWICWFSLTGVRFQQHLKRPKFITPCLAPGCSKAFPSYFPAAAYNSGYYPFIVPTSNKDGTGPWFCILGLLPSWMQNQVPGTVPP